MEHHSFSATATPICCLACKGFFRAFVTPMKDTTGVLVELLSLQTIMVLVLSWSYTVLLAGENLGVKYVTVVCGSYQ